MANEGILKLREDKLKLVQKLNDFIAVSISDFCSDNDLKSGSVGFDSHLEYECMKNIVGDVMAESTKLITNINIDI